MSTWWSMNKTNPLFIVVCLSQYILYYYFLFLIQLVNLSYLIQIKNVIDSLPLSNHLKRYYTALETLSVSIFH